jgi:hypothetical protein
MGSLTKLPAQPHHIQRRRWLGTEQMLLGGTSGARPVGCGRNRRSEVLDDCTRTLRFMVPVRSIESLQIKNVTKLLILHQPRRVRWLASTSPWASVTPLTRPLAVLGPGGCLSGVLCRSTVIGSIISKRPGKTTPFPSLLLGICPCVATESM